MSRPTNTRITNKGIFRTCRICKIEKTLDDFYKDRCSSYGHSYECIDCRSKHRLEGRESMRKYSKEYKADLKFSVLAIYSEGQPICACCGETLIEFLTIDHINNDGAKHRMEIGGRKDFGGHQLYRWLIKQGFPEGYRVLCINCNFSLGHYGYCPHNNSMEN